VNLRGEEITLAGHFGVNIHKKSDGLKLTRDNYIKVKNKSTLRKGMVYDDSFINKHIENCLYNYDLSLEYFRSLSKEEFNKELMNFVSKTKFFKEITDLVPLSGISGYYIMVLDEYSQAYIGRGIDIKGRIQTHWSRQMDFDRLIFGSKENSILSIDSFRAHDTTRIFVYPTHEHVKYEDKFINMFNENYLLNRTSGGKLSGLREVIINRKTRKLSDNA
jgi:hypothetical protein